MSTGNRIASPRFKIRVKLPNVRPSRRLCEERLACRTEKSFAIYCCQDCKTFQCEECEVLLHINSKFVLHERELLTFPSEEILCHGNCEFKNFADVNCPSCNKQFCFACDFETHTQKKQSHSRTSFEFVKEEYFSTEPGESDIIEESNLDAKSDCSDISEEMLSLSSLPVSGTLPDVASPGHSVEPAIIDSCDKRDICSFLLVDDKEQLQVSSEKDFIEKLGCNIDDVVKVICIFGNTGDGKSHTLNHTFYNGYEVFKTSFTQRSCTIGVWAAYDPTLGIVTIDTEGLLGVTSNPNQRTRLLLKVLAVSDIVIFRTRAERLHNDLFTFLGDASQAYIRHFSQELRAALERCKLDAPLSSLGPAVIVFHETQFTDILSEAIGKNPVDELKMRFQELGLQIDAFSALDYVGTRSARSRTSFESLKAAARKHLQNSTVRSARCPGIIYHTLKGLNEKFNGDIEKTVTNTFPDQYFSCPIQCLSCSARCMNSMNHKRDGIPHSSNAKCKYQHQYNNQKYLCKTCYEKHGQEVVVEPKTAPSTESSFMGIMKYAWEGYVLECPNCGIIYKSRKYWFGNKEPTEIAVRSEICHVWNGESIGNQANQYTAQRMIDGIQYVSGTVTTITAKPTKVLGSWITDKIAPSYWIPNYLITHCSLCQNEFGLLESKHHCRACGKGFCENCSSKTRPVPERGWGSDPVRVCNLCFETDTKVEKGVPEVTARYVGETLHSALGTLASAFDLPAGFIKDSARPTYWVPDHLLNNCNICHESFSWKLPIHHCRACGQGVCDSCSPSFKPVPSRDWHHPVRVCKKCEDKRDL